MVSIPPRLHKDVCRVAEIWLRMVYNLRTSSTSIMYTIFLLLKYVLCMIILLMNSPQSSGNVQSTYFLLVIKE